MPKRHWNKLKNDSTIEAEKQNRKKLRKLRKAIDKKQYSKEKSNEKVYFGSCLSSLFCYNS